MGDPVTMALGAQAASGIFGGLQASGAAKAEKQQAEINAYIGRTRAIQTDTTAREGLNDELGTMRATLAAAGQRPGVGTMAVVDELRRVRNRDRRIEFGNRMQEAADYRTAAKNAGARARSAVLGGIIKAGPSLFDIYDYSRGT